MRSSSEGFQKVLDQEDGTFAFIHDASQVILNCAWPAPRINSCISDWNGRFTNKQSTVGIKFFPLDHEPDWSPDFHLLAELSEAEVVGFRLQGLPHVIGEAGGDNEVLRSQIGKDNSEDLSIEK